MRNWILLFVGVLVLTLVVRFPLSLALAWSGAPITAERVTGTIWNGQLTGVRAQGYDIGRVDIAARPLALLTGRFGADLAVSGPLVTGTASLAAGTSRVAVDEADLRVDISPLGLRDAFEAPMAGQVELAARDLVLTPEGCRQGIARVETDTLVRSAKRYGGEGFVLAGDGKCEDGIFLLPLSGEGPEGAAEVTIRLSRSGYQTELMIEPTDPDLAAALSAYGFQQQGTRYSLIQRGEVF